MNQLTQIIFKNFDENIVKIAELQKPILSDTLTENIDKYNGKFDLECIKGQSAFVVCSLDDVCDSSLLIMCDTFLHIECEQR